jgi:hypothetical protein
LAAIDRSPSANLPPTGFANASRFRADGRNQGRQLKRPSRREWTTIYHRQRKSPRRRHLDAGAGERNQALTVDRLPIARRVQ